MQIYHKDDSIRFADGEVVPILELMDEDELRDFNMDPYNELISRHREGVESWVSARRPVDEDVDEKHPQPKPKK